tara:strand:+ start:87 stop:320 length:234 start_codon:yes stop_codon:yes gene_type:complete
MNQKIQAVNITSVEERMYSKDEVLGIINRTLNTLNNIDVDTKPLIDRINQDGYIMNDNDNREMKMRIDALKSVLYGC